MLLVWSIIIEHDNQYNESIGANSNLFVREVSKWHEQMQSLPRRQRNKIY